MDYFLKEIQEKITLFDGESKVKIYYQMRVEYIIVLILAYLWNKNFNRLTNFRKQGDMSRRIKTPTIGAVINLAKQLDIDNEFFYGDSPIFEYPDIRNKYVGHGYSMEDNVEEFTQKFDDIYKKILAKNFKLINNEVNYIYVEEIREDLNLYIGRLFTPAGRVQRWRYSIKAASFSIGNIYISFDVNEYFRVSPFLNIELPRKLYLFKCIGQLLTGEVVYNRIDESQFNFTKKWKELISDLSPTDGLKRSTPNKTIINIYEKNYEKYIDVGLIREKILRYLTGSRKNSSVAITIWGHGGVGKTATVQHICEYLTKDDTLKSSQKYDYVVFLSAKDRLLTTETAKIETIEDSNRISTFEDIIEKTNHIVFDTISSCPDKLLNFDKKLLLIIDDYETIANSEKEKIVDFIEQLNVKHHKVVITTRNKFLEIGKSISTNELDINNTIQFLFEVLSQYYGFTDGQLNQLNQTLNNVNHKQKIYLITSGRPLFIFIFANYINQIGSLSKTLDNEKVKGLRSSEEAVEFLFGRAYNQLEKDRLAQDIFTIIGLITQEEKLTNLINHVKYILERTLENDDDFELSLKTMVDLKIIEVKENFYKVYSAEILKMMRKQFDLRGEKFKTKSKLKYKAIERNIHKDTGEALLINANHSINSGFTEQQVIKKYEEIINIKSIADHIRMEALLNLTDYLFNSRGNKEQAIKVFEANNHYLRTVECIIRYSEYSWLIETDDYKQKSIEILSVFLAEYEDKTKNITLTKEGKARLLGNLVLKMKSYWENNKAVSSPRNTLHKEYKNIIDSYGLKLFKAVQYIDITILSPAEREDIFESLVKLAEISNHVNNKIFSIDVCEFILKINNLPTNIKKEIESKYKIAQKIPTNNYRKSKKNGKKQFDYHKVYKGTIVKVKSQDGYGFIKCNSFNDTIFFHASDLIISTFDTILEEDEIYFQVAKDKIGRIKAIKATLALDWKRKI